MANRSSILAWRIPQTVWSLGSQSWTQLSNFHLTTSSLSQAVLSDVLPKSQMRCEDVRAQRRKYGGRQEAALVPWDGNGKSPPQHSTSVWSWGNHQPIPNWGAACKVPRQPSSNIRQVWETPTAKRSLETQTDSGQCGILDGTLGHKSELGKSSEIQTSVEFSWYV